MTLHTTVTGAEATALPPVILVHGLFGQGRNLGVLARALAETRRVVSVDMRNHGDSFWDDDHSYDALAADLAKVIEDHGGQADVLGHSMGGKASMWLALTRPALVRRLAVMDIAPVTYGHSQTRLIEVMLETDFSACATRSAADALLGQRIKDPGTRAFLLQSLDLKAQPPRWRMNLETLRAQMEALTGFPDAGRRQFTGPTLLLYGADSDYVDDAGRATMRALFPDVQIETIAGTGHWLHAEKPAEVAAHVTAFLNG